MSEDQFTVTSSTGWFSRIGNSIKGILIGVLLIIISFPVLFYNEGRAVETRKTLDEGEKSYVTVGVDDVDPANDGKLVYLTGEAEAEGILSDPDFMVSAGALKLRRVVEVYQWEEESRSETKKKLGGGEETVTTYTYTKTWSDDYIDWSNFKKPQGHENPRPALDDKDWSAKPITVGAFTLSSGLVWQIDNYSEVVADNSVELPETIAGKRVTVQGDGFYLGENPSNPEIGDLRVTHQAAMPGPVSIVAKQVGSSFEPYVAEAGGSISMLETGTQSAESMFTAAHARNKALTWGLRLLGVVLMFIGFSLIFHPLSVLADVLPLAGTIVGAGTTFIALLISLVISLLVISVAWVYYRPMIGIPIIILAVVCFGYMIRKLSAERKRQSGAMPPPYRAS